MLFLASRYWKSLHLQHGYVVNCDVTDTNRPTGIRFGHAEEVAQDSEVGARLAAARHEGICHRVEEQWRIAERSVSFGC